MNHKLFVFHKLRYVLFTINLFYIEKYIYAKREHSIVYICLYNIKHKNAKINNF